MFILTKLILTVRVEGVFSLKQKRSIVKRLKTYVVNTCNACIAESHQQDSLRYIGLTIGFLSNSANVSNSLLQKLTEEIEIISEGLIEEEQIQQL